MAVKTCKVICTDAQLSIKPNHLELIVKKKTGKPDDQGAWQCNDGSVEIIFNKTAGHPWTWASSTIPAGAAATNFGAPTVSVGKTYPYTMIIHRAGQPDITVDPVVVVTEGGPPGGKKAVKKKAAKKASKKK